MHRRETHSPDANRMSPFSGLTFISTCRREGLLPLQNERVSLSELRRGQHVSRGALCFQRFPIAFNCAQLAFAHLSGVHGFSTLPCVFIGVLKCSNVPMHFQMFSNCDIGVQRLSFAFHRFLLISRAFICVQMFPCVFIGVQKCSNVLLCFERFSNWFRCLE